MEVVNGAELPIARLAARLQVRPGQMLGAQFKRGLSELIYTLTLSISPSSAKPSLQTKHVGWFDDAW